eukprot:4101160-Prymnesium_polylepis.1
MGAGYIPRNVEYTRSTTKRTIGYAAESCVSRTNEEIRRRNRVLERRGHVLTCHRWSMTCSLHAPLACSGPRSPRPPSEPPSEPTGGACCEQARERHMWLGLGGTVHVVCGRLRPVVSCVRGGAGVGWCSLPGLGHPIGCNRTRALNEAELRLTLSDRLAADLDTLRVHCALT